MYKIALELSPNHAEAASNLAMMIADEGEVEEAEYLFLRTLEQIECRKSQN